MVRSIQHLVSGTGFRFRFSLHIVLWIFPESQSDTASVSALSLRAHRYMAYSEKAQMNADFVCGAVYHGLSAAVFQCILSQCVLL